MAKFDYALGYRLVDFTSKEAYNAGTAKGQPNEGQCATAVSAWAFWHGYTDVNILGNGGQRFEVAKKAGYKVGQEVKPWSWICYGTGYYGKYRISEDIRGFGGLLRKRTISSVNGCKWRRRN